jgi:hypothetical protein
MADATIHLKPAGLPWRVLGKELYEGVLPTPPQVVADAWGFASCSFSLPRDPFLPQPDLSAYTPCVIEEGGAVLFEGKVVETPATGDPEPSINVTGRGTQYALDENPVEGCWAHTNLGDWKDVRGLGGYNASFWRPDSMVEVGNTITLGKSNGTNWVHNDSQGVYIDLGPNCHARGVRITYTTNALNGNTVFDLYARGTTDSPSVALTKGAHFATGAEVNDTGAPMAGRTWSDAFIIVDGTFDSPETLGFFYPPARTIVLFLLWEGGGGTTGADHTISISSIELFDVSGRTKRKGPHNLRATDVIQDVVERAASHSDIVVPEQSPLGDTTDYIDELWGLAGDGAAVVESGYWRFTPANRLGIESGWGGAAAWNVNGTPAYADVGGPLIDGDNGSYIDLGTPANCYIWRAPPYVWSWTIIFWFKTTSPATNVPTTWSDLDKAMCFSNGAFTSAGAEWGIGVDANGDFRAGYRWTGTSADITKAGSYADGQWHLVHATFDWFTGLFEFAVDDEGEGYYYSDQSGSSRSRFLSERGKNTPFNVVFNANNGGVKVGDYQFAEIFMGKQHVSSGDVRHLYRAARRNYDTPLKRTKLRLPGFATSAPRVGRELADALNVYHRFIIKVGRDHELEFRPQETVPKYALTAAASRRFENASLTAGEEAYNRVEVVGTRANGDLMRIERVAAHQPWAVFETPDTVAVRNPSADVDLTGVSNISGITSAPTPTLSRDTGTFDTAPASFLMSSEDVTTNLTSAMMFGMTGRFLRGRLYRLRIRIWNETNAGQPIKGSFGSLDRFDYASFSGVWGTAGTWQTATADWIPQKDYEAGMGFTFFSDEPVLRIEGPGSATAGIVPKSWRIDSIELTVGVASQLDRQNKLRTRIIEHSMPLNDDIGQSMGDAFLHSRARQQLRGSVDVGLGDIARYGTGELIHPRYLVEDTMELLHIPSLIDPDTGTQGRDGKMVSVSYDSATERASIAIDNQIDNFEVLMQRWDLFSSRT